MLPDSFRFLDHQVSLVVPYQFDRSKTFLGQFSYAAIARLTSGVTFDQANADAARMLPIALASLPPFAGLSVKMFEEARLTPHILSLKDDLVVQRNATYLVRSARTGTSGFADELSQAIWAINPNLPLASVRTLKAIYDGSLERTSFTLVMLAIAGAMALVLGVAGIYGVMSECFDTECWAA